jgi:hypothetical protein
MKKLMAERKYGPPCAPRRCGRARRGGASADRYVPCDSRAADLLFHIVSRRYEKRRSFSRPISPTSSGARSFTTPRALARSSTASPSTATRSTSTPSRGATRTPSIARGTRRSRLPTRPDPHPPEASTATKGRRGRVPNRILFLRISVTRYNGSTCTIAGYVGAGYALCHGESGAAVFHDLTLLVSTR